MADETIDCQWIPRGDTETIEEYRRAGWRIREVDCHHAAHAVLAVLGEFRQETEMPNVGGKTYAYTPEGKKKARVARARLTKAKAKPGIKKA